MNPLRGQTGFEINPPKSPLSTPSGGSSGGGGFGCVVSFLIFAAVCTHLVTDTSGPSSPESSLSSSSSSSSIQSGASSMVPIAPRPRYARFELAAREGQQSPASVTFSNERLDIRRVATLDELPSSVRNAAKVIRHGAGSISPRKDSRPYIVIGDVSVTVGSLRGEDRWSALMTTDSDSFNRIDAETLLRDFPSKDGKFVVDNQGRVTMKYGPKPGSTLSPIPRLPALANLETKVEPDLLPDAVDNPFIPIDEARPPPVSRTVYIVGTITAVKGPALAERSSANIDILDLRVSERDLREYKTAVLRRQFDRPGYPDWHSGDHLYDHPGEFHPSETYHPPHVEPVHPAFHGIP